MTCASALTEGGQTSSHADDTRGLMTAVLLGGISQDDLTVSFTTCKRGCKWKPSFCGLHQNSSKCINCHSVPLSFSLTHCLMHFVAMSCFGGWSPMLGAVLRLHCGGIFCPPSALGKSHMTNIHAAAGGHELIAPRLGSIGTVPRLHFGRIVCALIICQLCPHCSCN